MAPLTEREEAERDDLLDLSRYIASVPSALFATELTEKELVVAQALIVVGGTL